MIQLNELDKNFFKRADTSYLDTLIDHLSDVYFFVKDKNSRFVKVNKNFLKLFGFVSESDVIGLTDYEMVSRELAIQYERDDHFVMTSGEIYELKEPVSSAEGLVSMHITTKIPVKDVNGEVIGVAGITRDTVKTEIVIRPMQELQKVVELIDRDYRKNIKVEELAELVGMSHSTFFRRFKKHFKMSPIQYIRGVRLKVACKLLLESDMSLGDITYYSGFCDQSHMTREFRKSTGLTPRVYQKKYKV